jgi:hypothetical protein
VFVGNGNDEDLKLNLDDGTGGANSGEFTSSTGLAQLTFTGISLNTDSANGYQMFGTKFFYGSTTNHSIAIGESAGRLFNGSALNNVAIGQQAGYNATSSGGNVFVGYQTGYDVTSGAYNSFVGYLAGGYDTIGGYNSFFGNTAGGRNTTGAYNTALGVGASRGNQTGDSNVTIGYQAGAAGVVSQYSYSRSTMVGYQAGYNVPTRPPIISLPVLIILLLGMTLMRFQSVVATNSTSVTSSSVRHLMEQVRRWLQEKLVSEHLLLTQNLP